MWFWRRETGDGQVSVLAQRAAYEGPRCMRAVETSPPLLPAGMKMVGITAALQVTRHALRVTTLCLLLAGCATVTPTEDLSLRRATAEELTTLLRQRESAIQSMKGLFTAKVRGGVIPIATRVEGALYYRRPNAMRLRGFTSIGSELFELVQVDDLYRLRLPTMGRVLAGRQSEMGDMGKLARPFQLSLWAMNGMLGTGTIAPGEAVKLTEEGDRYRLDVYENQSSDASLLRRVWFDRHNLLVVQEDRFTSSGDLDATIRYEDFRLIENAAPGPLQAKAGEAAPLLRPFKISLEDGRGQGSVQVTFHEIVPNQVLKAEDLGQIS